MHLVLEVNNFFGEELLKEVEAKLFILHFILAVTSLHTLPLLIHMKEYQPSSQVLCYNSRVVLEEHREQLITNLVLEHSDPSFQKQRLIQDTN